MFSSKNSAFTLIESIVVMVILSTAIAGAVYLLGSVIFITEQNKKQITALYLAEECAELVRNLRDTAWKKHLPWDCMFENSSINTEFTIEPDHANTASSVCGNNLGIHWKKISNADESLLYFNGTKYSHQRSSDVTPFFRKVILKNLVSGTNGENQEILVDCEVSWKYQNKWQKTTLSTLLTDWKR